jgi:Na+-transporting methylmalonyl-CoA/oxaloacetate decarboxylase gamma subunit
LDVNTVLQGLVIAVVGMGLVFLALGLIVLAMVLMGRYLRPRPSSDEGASEPESEMEDRARVAAMVAAIVLAQEQDNGHPGDAWPSTGWASAPSPWQASHRSQTLTRQPGRPKERGTKL